MAQVSKNGAAQNITVKDFNERMKHVLAGKRDPQPAPKREANPRAFKPAFTKKPA